MIRRVRPFSGIHVHGNRRTFPGQGLGGKNVIDSPPTVRLEGIRLTVIPKGKLLPIRMQATKHVFESPADRVRVRGSSFRVKTDVRRVSFRVMHVNGLRSHVHVSTPDGGLIGRQVPTEIPTQPVKPLQFILILRMVNHEALGDVGIDDGNALHHGVQQSRPIRVGAFIQPERDPFRLPSGAEGYPVVPFHSAKRDVIAGGGQFFLRKFRILHLGFLQAQHVRRMVLQPPFHHVQAFPNGIHVKGCQLQKQTRTWQ